MIYKFNINSRAFCAIKNKTKRVEIRCTKLGLDNFDYGILNINDNIEFTSFTGEKMLCLIKKVNHYKSIEDLLTYEGTKYTLSSTNCYEEGIKSINSIEGYKDLIPVNGIYAIHIEYLNSY